MKFTATTLYLVLGLGLGVSGVTVPVSDTSAAIGNDLEVFHSLSSREDHDGEWTYVLFDGGKKGDQCGGVEVTDVHSSSSGKGCSLLSQIVGCATLDVSANLGFAKCNFSFKKQSCADSGAAFEVARGQSKTVSLPSVQFVSVSCKK